MKATSWENYSHHFGNPTPFLLFGGPTIFLTDQRQLALGPNPKRGRDTKKNPISLAHTRSSALQMKYLLVTIWQKKISTFIRCGFYITLSRSWVILQKSPAFYIGFWDRFSDSFRQCSGARIRSVCFEEPMLANDTPRTTASSFHPRPPGRRFLVFLML